MIRIVGKWLMSMVFMLVVCTAAHGSITLRVTDNQSHQLDQVGIGQPFVIEALLKGDVVSQGEPTIEGLENINGRRCGYQMKSINGVSSVTYTYRARIDREGEYAIGPAHVGSYSSPALTILVTQEAKAREKKHEKKEKVFLQFTIDQNDVVVGERIGCCLRFLYADGSTSLKTIGQQELPGFTQSSVQGPEAGTQQIDGHTYNYVQWCWDLFAQVAGEFVLPAHYADYTVPAARHGMWAHFGSFMHANDLKRLYSNGHAVVVRSLEDAPYPVCAIGKDIEIEATLDTSSVTQSDAVILTIEVSGEFRSQSARINELHGMPNEIKWYRSQTTPVDEHTIRTEFVLQGIKSGDYDIPAQKMCYFDTESRVYHILETEPLRLTVIPSQTRVDDAPERFDDSCAVSIEHNESPLQPSLTLSSSPFTAVPRDGQMPWWLFFSILWISTAYVLVPFRALYTTFFASSSKRMYKSAFANAHARLQKAQKNHDAKKIYEIFVHLLSVRCAIPLEQLSVERIDHEFYNRFVDEELRNRWNQFFNRALECSFGMPQSSSDQEALFVSAFDWLETVKKIV